MTKLSVEQVVRKIFETAQNEDMPWCEIDIKYRQAPPKELASETTLKPLSEAVWKLAQLGLDGERIRTLLNNAHHVARRVMDINASNQERLIGFPAQHFFDPHMPLGIAYEAAQERNGYYQGPKMNRGDVRTIRKSFEQALDKYVQQRPDYLDIDAPAL